MNYGETDFMKKQRTILNAKDIERAIIRISCEIIEAHKGADNLALIGIMTRGDFLANRLKNQIEKLERISIPVGDMDINLYRDDWTRISSQPIVRPSKIPFSVDEKEIILVDDVLFTGRTIRAAMDALMDFGRPSRIELAVLVDRGHRELPLQADYKGVCLNTIYSDMVNVHIVEHDGNDRVFIEQD